MSVEDYPLWTMWDSFIRHADDSTRAYIGDIDRDVAKYLGSEGPGVWLQCSYARKLQKKHNLDAPTVIRLLAKLRRAIVIEQAPRKFSFVCADDGDDKPYIVGLKVAGTPPRLYISTIHRTDERQLARMQRSKKVVDG